METNLVQIQLSVHLKTQGIHVSPGFLEVVPFVAPSGLCSTTARYLDSSNYGLFFLPLGETTVLYAGFASCTMTYKALLGKTRVPVRPDSYFLSLGSRSRTICSVSENSAFHVDWQVFQLFTVEELV